MPRDAAHSKNFANKLRQWRRNFIGGAPVAFRQVNHVATTVDVGLAIRRPDERRATANAMAPVQG